ncbi:MAG: hypothetical protein ACK57E_11895 [Erythrobacteraceae bacterium]
MQLKTRFCAVVLTLTLAACGTSEQALQREATQSESATAVAQASASEAGSGTYASDCSDAASAFVVSLVKGQDGMVEGEVKAAGKTYSNLLTSYSFMGDATPSEFLIAVIFDEANAPVDAKVEGGPRLEIWKDSGSFIALMNGDKAKKLALCPLQS